MATAGVPKIAIYGVGQYGGLIARLAVDKGWPVVAAFNRAGPKVGQDLGRVIGLNRDLGVVIQDCETADYSQLDADIGIVAQTNILAKNFPAYERLLSAGVNVGCHGAESYYPQGCNPELAARIDQLAKDNGVTFTGSGIWDMSRIWAGILVAGPCTTIRSLFHRSITDAVGQAQGAEQARVVGIGMTSEEFYQAGMDQHPLARSYVTVATQTLVYHGHTVISTRSDVEPVTFDYDYECPWTHKVLPAGTCMGSRVIGHAETDQGVTARTEVDLRLFHDGEVEHMYWEVDGEPRTSLRTERKDSRHATAASLFHRIPNIIDARPGVVTVAEMGPLVSTSGAQR